jgi:CRISPR/Cas system CSM-associated protein Csm3 (group 7 of RAMP superfamily)
MHRALYLEGRLKLTIEPDGPILIKAGETGGADPSRPDMEFVRTKHRGTSEIYLPGPSLKGVVRAQCERIARTLDSEALQQARLEQRAVLDSQTDGKLPADEKVPLADNPLGSKDSYRGLNDLDYSSGKYMERLQKKLDDHTPNRTAVIYRRSSFTSQMFGHTSLAGRVRFADAYGEGVQLEERNGVAIDRVYGSVAVGPFNYETAVAGRFPTTIDFKNTTLAHLALLGLALRDLAAGRVALGFGKSRGLGRVKLSFDSLELHYPMCQIEAGQLQLLSGRAITEVTKLAGAGAFELQPDYAFPTDDLVPLPEGMRYQDDEDMGIGVVLRAEGDEAVRAFWKACIPAWKRLLLIEVPE